MFGGHGHELTSKSFEVRDEGTGLIACFGDFGGFGVKVSCHVAFKFVGNYVVAYTLYSVYDIGFVIRYTQYGYNLVIQSTYLAQLPAVFSH